MYRTSKNQLVKRTGISAVVALGALATGVGIAGASSSSAKAPSTTKNAVVSSQSRGGAKQVRGSMLNEGPDMMRGLGGLVTAVDATSITVQDRKGTSTTYAIDSSTKVTKERQTAAVAGIVTGEHVRIMTSSSSSSSSSSTTTATGIDIELARVGGQVVSVDKTGNTITVSDRDGFYRIISVSGSTTYSKSGATAALSDVSVGSFIMAEGTVDANHTTLDASAVGIGQPGSKGSFNGAGPHGMGPQGMPGGFGDMNAGMH